MNPDHPPATRDRILSCLGWIGMLAVVLAFACANLHWIERGVLYFSLNGLGSLFLCASNIVRRNIQSLTLNGVWAAIAAVSLVELLS